MQEDLTDDDSFISTKPYYIMRKGSVYMIHHSIRREFYIKREISSVFTQAEKQFLEVFSSFSDLELALLGITAEQTD